MRLSELFTKTRKQVPADESSKNAQLLIQAGFIHKEMAGVYSFLPLGKRVLDNIAQIVRKEMDAVGGQEILMPALQLKERYEKTGRWDDQVVDNWFKTKLVNGAELGLGFSHEENLSPLLKNFLGSYKDLPLMIYQIQTKFRNELRSKSGLLRGREFLMKDMYSFAISQKQHEQVYEKIKQAYYKIYERLGIGQQTFLTFASGGVFTKFSHEFQTLTDAGEDTIYLDRQKRLAINREVISDEVIQNLGLNKKDLEQVRGVEVGNIFSLGTKFSDPFELAARDEQGEPVTLIMGCYGLGISRVMGTIIELLADDKGLVWPETIAPFKVYLARLGSQKAVITAAEELYKVLTHRGITVLYDNRDESAGTKLTDADLMGIPYRLVVSDKTQQNHHYELKKRTDTKTQLLTENELIKKLVA